MTKDDQKMITKDESDLIAVLSVLRLFGKNNSVIIDYQNLLKLHKMYCFVNLNFY